MRDVTQTTAVPAIRMTKTAGGSGSNPEAGAVEGSIGGALGEDRIEARLQRGTQGRIGVATIGFEVGFEIPNLAAHPRLVGTLLVVERDERVHQPFGVHPAQCMRQDRELSGPVADDRRIQGEPHLDQSARQGSLGGDAPMAQARDPEGVEMRLPSRRARDRGEALQLPTRRCGAAGRPSSHQYSKAWELRL